MKPMTPQDLSWIDRAPISVTRSRRIDASADAVWAAIADHASWPQWFKAIESVIPGAVADAAGGTRQVTLGPVTVDEEFLAFEPEKRFAFTLTAASRGPLRSMVEDVRLTPDGDAATTVSYTQAMDLPGARVLRPVLARGMARAIDGGLAGLAAHLGG